MTPDKRYTFLSGRTNDNMAEKTTSNFTSEILGELLYLPFAQKNKAGRPGHLEFHLRTTLGHYKPKTLVLIRNSSFGNNLRVL